VLVAPVPPPQATSVVKSSAGHACLIASLVRVGISLDSNGRDCNEVLHFLPMADMFSKKRAL